MTSVIGFLLSYVLLYKYLAIFIAIFAGAIIVPVPSVELLMAAGAFASQGVFNFWIALAVGLSGNVLGDLVDYFLSRRYGEAVLHWLRLDKRKFIGQLETEVRQGAPFMIFATRIAGALGPAVNVLAGVSNVPFRTFLLYDVTGNLVDIGGALLIGFMVGSYWEDFSAIANIAVAIAVVAIVMFVLWRISRRIIGRDGRTEGQ